MPMINNANLWKNLDPLPHHAEYHIVEYCYADWHYAECCYAESCYAECHSTECHSAECHDAKENIFQNVEKNCVITFRLFNLLKFFSGFIIHLFYLIEPSAMSLLLGLTQNNGIVHIRHQCRKTTVLRFHRCLIKTGVEKLNNT